MRRNGLYSPFGIETFRSNTYSPHLILVGMASTARLGLKRRYQAASLRGHCRRNGLYSPFGIETKLLYHESFPHVRSEWPLQPVWD